MSRYLLGVVTHLLPSGVAAQSRGFNRTCECTWALLEFYIYVPYQSHDDATLSYIDDALHHVHTFKDVVLLGRAGKKVMANANALSTELIKKRKVDEETHADTGTASKQRGTMNAWRDSISHEIDVSNELDAEYNFPKIHLMSHWLEQIGRYGALHQYTAERHE